MLSYVKKKMVEEELCCCFNCKRMDKKRDKWKRSAILNKYIENNTKGVLISAIES